MNKKFFSALLMGSLLLGGTFVSCKDYDDDIENLQLQINKLASTDQLSSQVSTLQSQISAAQAAAEAKAATAQALAQTAKEIADKAATPADVALAVKEAADKAANDLAAEKAALETKYAEALAAAQAAQGDATSALEELATVAKSADLAKAIEDLKAAQAAADKAQATADEAKTAAATVKSEAADALESAVKAMKEAQADGISAAKIELAALAEAAQKAADEAKKVADAAATPADVKAEVDAAVKTLEEAIADVKTTADAAVTAEELIKEIAKVTDAIKDAETAAEKAAADAAKAALDKALAADLTEAQVEAIAQKLADEAKSGAVKEAAEAAQKAIAEATKDLAKADELAKEVEALEGKIEAAQAAAIAAAKEYVDGKGYVTAADIAAAIEKHVADVHTDLDDALKALELDLAIVKENLGLASEGDVKSVAEQLAAIKTAYEEAIATAIKGLKEEVATMVTGVSLYVQKEHTKPDLNFKAVSEQSTVFGKGLPNEITFSAGNTNSQKTAEVSVRVNPINATFKAEDVTLINSKGEALDLVEVVSVAPYNGALLTRADNNGLWVIKFQLKENVSMAQLKAATFIPVWDKKTNKYVDTPIAYAVSIATSEERAAISEYDVKAAPDTWTAVKNLEFIAWSKDNKWVDVKDIHNRYLQSETGEETNAIPELVWYNDPATTFADNTGGTAYDHSAGIPSIAEKVESRATDLQKGIYANAIDAHSQTVTSWTDEEKDDRQSKELLPVEVDKAIDIKICWNTVDGVPANDVAGFYVTLDAKRAVESAPSEYNAWTSYVYEGLDSVFVGNEGSIKIKSASANGDVIGFRVYAVNLDGTLLDPDGRAFYVYVGDMKNQFSLEADVFAESKTNAYSRIFTPDEFSAVFSGITNLTPTGWTNTIYPKYKDANGNIITNDELFNVQYTTNNLNANNLTWTDLTSNNIASIDWSLVKGVRFQMETPNSFVDNQTYEQKMEFYRNVGNSTVLVKTITMKAKKVLPTDAPNVQLWPLQNGNIFFATSIPATSVTNYVEIAAGSKALASLTDVFNIPNGDYCIEATAADYQKDQNGDYITDNDGNYISGGTAVGNVTVNGNALSNPSGAVTVSNGKLEFGMYPEFVNASAQEISFSKTIKDISYTYNSKTKQMETNVYKVPKAKVFDVSYKCWHHDATITVDSSKLALNWSQSNATNNTIKYDLRKMVVSSAPHCIAFQGWTLSEIIRGEKTKEGDINSSSTVLKVTKVTLGDIAKTYFSVNETPVPNVKEVIDVTYEDGSTDSHYEYFMTINFTQKTGSHQPQEEADDVVTVEFKDGFGHKFTKQFTVHIKAVQ